MAASKDSAEDSSADSRRVANEAPGPRRAQHEADCDHPTLLGWRQWIAERFNWSWFTCTQSTGGIAVLLSECPKQFSGLQTIGTIVFIFDIVLFLLFTALILIRWTLSPAKIRACFTVPPECFFFGSWWLSTATLIICMQRFGVSHTGPWLITAIRICFWIYAACTLLSTTIMFVVMGKHTPNSHVGMNPAILLSVFQAMLTGTVAAAIGSSQPPYHRLPIMVAGIGYQGYGWILSLVYLSFILTTLLEKGWPAVNLRPGLFMTVGTGGYTIVVLIGNARAAPVDYGYFAAHPTAPEILLILAVWTSVFLWVFTFWLFAIALIIVFADMFSRQQTGLFKTNMSFNNTFWGAVFPNVGFTIATIYLGQELGSDAVLWVSTAMVILVVTVWLFDVVLMAKTVAYSLFWDSRVKLS